MKTIEKMCRLIVKMSVLGGHDVREAIGILRAQGLVKTAEWTEAICNLCEEARDILREDDE